MAPVNMTPSAYKHGFEIEEAIYVMDHFVGREALGRIPGGSAWAYVGYLHEGSDRKMELLANWYPPRTVEVFHFMDLTDKYRRLWKDESWR